MVNPAYLDFLRSKIPVAENTGFTPNDNLINPMLKPHQADLVRWAINGGRRAIFARFGLGKTFMQLMIARQVSFVSGEPFLIGIPLGVKGEFYIDADKLGLDIAYVRNQEEAEQAVADGVMILISNYERIRGGNFKASYFGGVSFDEASILRGLDTETTEYILTHFMQVPYRFVCTATPSPNEYTELLNYAHFLGIMDRGQALTRFFQRDSQKAGHLTLYPHKEREFWLWISSWAVFLTKPSDLGYDDEGYDLPPMDVRYHCVNVKERQAIIDRRDGSQQMFANVAASLSDAAREKRNSVASRIDKAMEIVHEAPNDNFILWHHREDEREAIEQSLPPAKTVYGSQDPDTKESLLISFGKGEYQYLATKPEIAGSGCNFQRFCHRAIFVGIDYKFNDFIQAIHRIYRFMQYYAVGVDIIYTDAEEPILKALLAKWERHKVLEQQMTDIIRTYGLSNTSIAADMARRMGVLRQEAKGESYELINNDNVLEVSEMESDSIGMICTSIPFGDQYEYVESYHDMGHNDGNAGFFEHLNFLTPELYRVTMPGRIACIHVKDRIRYSYQNGVGFTSLEDFSGMTVAHFVKHGWHLMGKHTITTDVVQENNQTYRLGWSEQCKDGTKMGCGSPEYVLVFRKPPTDHSNSFADIPVVKTKDSYTRARWQMDAHAYWRSNGNRLLDPEELRRLDLSQIGKLWKEDQLNGAYDFERHLAICEALDSVGKLSATFMSLPLHSPYPDVWTDISRMHTLNSNQARKRQEKHVCPLQFDIVDRCIERYSNLGEIVFDPFNGIGTVVYRSIKLGRKGKGVELFDQYWKDSVSYCRDAEALKVVPSLFDS